MLRGFISLWRVLIKRWVLCRVVSLVGQISVDTLVHGQRHVGDHEGVRLSKGPEGRQGARY